jgi:hypothetical protein
VPDEIQARKALLDAAGSNWSIFDALSKTTEQERRRILRSHKEAPFSSSVDIAIRDAVDDTLGRLMLLELGFEIGVLDHEKDATLLTSIRGLPELFGSSAFVRYLDAYLYFSVRCVAGRLNLPMTTSPAANEPESDFNELPAPWPSPPAIPERLHQETLDATTWMISSETLTTGGNVLEALKFLDDFVLFQSEQNEYELWLRDLPHRPEHEPRFARITNGLLAFAREKVAFYTGLETKARVDRWKEWGRIAGSLSASHPLTARFGLFDLFWLAKILRADVSPGGVVTYKNGSWLNLIASRPPKGWSADDVLLYDEVLRAAFDYTCDLVQNASDIARENMVRGQQRCPDWPKERASWRVTCDEELEEIAQQRTERRFSAVEFLPDTDQSTKGQPGEEWSRRIRTGEHVGNLVGLSFSGGGIRSATFNLGVLQRLQELDLLRGVDYLSTVSGGGYIGAWLLGNVRRTRYWLTQPTDWGPSIEHLRRFSNYLAPRTGLMSADTWTMWGTWVRNALLLQVSAATWLALLMVTTLLGKIVFASAFFEPSDWYRGSIIVGALLVFMTGAIILNIRSASGSIKEWKILWFAVAPAWIGSYVTAAMLWADKPGAPASYGQILQHKWVDWEWQLLALFVCSWLVARLSMDGKGPAKIPFSMLPAAASLAVVYLGMSALRWLLDIWSADPYVHVWYAYSVTAPLLLCSMAIGVIVMIGLLGRSSPDWRREWWTRYGSWLGIYGISFLALGVVTIFGPLLVLRVIESDWSTIKWGAILGWIGTVIAGLFAGNSSHTNGDETGTMKARVISVAARFGAFMFIVGAVVGGALLVHVLLIRIWLSDRAMSAANYWGSLNAITTEQYLWSALALLALGAIFSWRVEINVFGLNQFYRNRLVRCYLGATRWVPGLRRPHKFTGFDERDDLHLAQFRHEATVGGLPYRGPFPIINCSLNLGGSSDLLLHTRHSASFTLSPIRCGADRRQVGFVPTKRGKESFAGGVLLGQAISVSGAAASPNMGYNTSPLVAFLLTMFNVRLGWWFPNPGRRLWNAEWLRFSLWYLVREIFAVADERRFFVNVSDGGHFENLGVYELIRRRCKVIIACDGECDPDLTFGSLGRLVRTCQTDFGACIDIDVESIRKGKGSDATGFSRAHCAVGRITYANGSRGYLIYLKASLTGDEDVSIAEYHSGHREFPHESTGDQFFAEDQFESYRRLGHHIAHTVFRDVEHERDLVVMAHRLAKLWVPASAASDSYVAQANSLVEMWERFRTSEPLMPLLKELTADAPSPARRPPNEMELCACLELVQLMENVFLELRLDEFWTHPDNRGWMTLFGMWAKSPTFRAGWERLSRTFGIRFGHFCHQRFGLADPDELIHEIRRKALLQETEE